MNLSNYLQMPPAPTAAASPGPVPGTAARALMGVDVAGQIRMDFAQIMAQQFQQLPAVGRQQLAASAPRASLDDATQARRAAMTSNAQATVAALSAHASHRAATPTATETTNAGRATQAKNQERASTDDEAAQEEDTRASARRANRASARNAAALALEGPEGWPAWLTAAWQTHASSLQASAPSGAGAAQDPMQAALTLPDGTVLQQVDIGPNLKVVTPSTSATTPQSLAQFAREMGWTDGTVQQLVGNAPHASGADGLATGWSGLAAAVLTQAQSNGAVHLTPAAPSPALMTQAVATGQDALNLGMLPVAPAAQAAQDGGIGLDIVQLGSSDLPEVQITALAESFMQDSAGSDASAGDSTPDNPHGQASLAASASGNAAPGTPVREGAQAGARADLADTFQRLSDKLSTEMAARMHQQLNAGQWKMKFGLRPAHLGSVEIQLEMKEGRLQADLATDNPLARELLQNGSQRLRESLANLGIQTERVTVGQGQTSFGQASSHGQGTGNPAAFGDNLSPSLATGPQESMSAQPARPRSDSQLDLYA